MCKCTYVYVFVNVFVYVYVYVYVYVQVYVYVNMYIYIYHGPQVPLIKFKKFDPLGPLSDANLRVLSNSCE